MSTNKQVNKHKTKLVRVDAEMHRLAKIKAAKSGESLRSLTDGGLAYMLGTEYREN